MGNTILSELYRLQVFHPSAYGPRPPQLKLNSRCGGGRIQSAERAEPTLLPRGVWGIVSADQRHRAIGNCRRTPRRAAKGKRDTKSWDALLGGGHGRSPSLDALDRAAVLDSQSHVEHDAAAWHASDGVEVRFDHLWDLEK